MGRAFLGLALAGGFLYKPGFPKDLTVRRSARNPGPGVRRLAGIYTVRAQASELQHCWSENRGF